MTSNVIELNDWIIAGAKLVYDKIGIPLGNLNKNTKPWWEIRHEGQIKKMQKRTKVLNKEGHRRIYWDEKTQNKTADKSNNTTWNKKYGRKKKDSKDTEAGNKEYKQNRTFQNTERKFY